MSILMTQSFIVHCLHFHKKFVSGKASLTMGTYTPSVIEAGYWARLKHSKAVCPSIPLQLIGFLSISKHQGKTSTKSSLASYKSQAWSVTMWTRPPMWSILLSLNPLHILLFEAPVHFSSSLPLYHHFSLRWWLSLSSACPCNPFSHGFCGTPYKPSFLFSRVLLLTPLVTFPLLFVTVSQIYQEQCRVLFSIMTM